MIEVEAVAEEPLLLGTAPEAGNLVDSHRHVPGSVVRGALAALWLRQHGGQHGGAGRSQFVELFEGKVHYGPLMAEGSALEPLSVLGCKYRAKPECATTVFDLGAIGGARPADPVCPVCQGPIEFAKGRVVGAAMVEMSRTKLTEWTVTSEGETPGEGMLFTRRGLACMALRGRINGSHPWLLSEQCNGSVAWLGGRRTVGGRARLALREVPDPVPVPRQDGLVCVRLVSPAIFVDSATRPSLDFPLTDMAALLGCEHVDLLHQWRRPVRIGGWHAASGLPKPQEIAVAAGSTVVLRPSAPVPAEVLGATELAGVGLRRSEGFGMIQVNPPPWEPPAQVLGTAAVASSSEVAFAELDALFAQAPSLRQWLVGELKDHALRLETGRPPSNVVDQVRARSLSSAQLNAFKSARANLGLSSLRELVMLLDAPRPAR